MQELIEFSFGVFVGLVLFGVWVLRLEVPLEAGFEMSTPYEPDICDEIGPHGPLFLFLRHSVLAQEADGIVGIGERPMGNH